MVVVCINNGTLIVKEPMRTNRQPSVSRIMRMFEGVKVGGVDWRKRIWNEYIF